MGNTSMKHTFSPLLFVKSLFSFLALLLFTNEPRPFFMTLDHHKPSPSLLLFLFFGQHHHLISSQAFSITIAIDSLLWVSPPPSPSIIFTVSFSHSSHLQPHHNHLRSPLNHPLLLFHFRSTTAAALYYCQHRALDNSSFPRHQHYQASTVEASP